MKRFNPGELSHPIHGVIRSGAPVRWEPEIVLGRMVEACLVMAATASPIRSPGNGWPEMMREWADYLGRGEDLRAETWAKWERVADRPSYDAATMSRAEEAMRWPMLFLADHPSESKAVMVHATTKAARKPLQWVLKVRRYPVSTFKKRRATGLRIITEGLSVLGVEVREAEVGVD
jgi:hypothetical protein